MKPIPVQISHANKSNDWTYEALGCSLTKVHNLKVWWGSVTGTTSHVHLHTQRILQSEDILLSEDSVKIKELSKHKNNLHHATFIVFR